MEQLLPSLSKVSEQQWEGRFKAYASLLGGTWLFSLRLGLVLKGACRLLWDASISEEEVCPFKLEPLGRKITPEVQALRVSASSSMLHQLRRKSTCLLRLKPGSDTSSPFKGKDDCSQGASLKGACF